MSNLTVKSAQVGAKLREWMDSNPELVNTIVRGLAGAAVGGAATAGLSALTPKDPEDKGGIRGSALTGALLGGAGAALLPLGLRTLKGQSGLMLPPQPKRPLVSRAVEGAVINPVVNNPLTTVGAGIGTIKAWDALNTLPSAMPARGRGVSRFDVKDLASRIKAGLRNKPAWEAARASGIKGARRGKLLLIPLLAAAGWLGDRYIKGDY